MADAKVSPTQLRLQNPLTPVTRKERTLLLFVSTIGIVMAKTGLVPEKISNFGIEFSTGDQDALLGLFAGVVLYFLIAFVIYAASDYVAWAAAGREAVRDWHQPDDGDSLAFQVGGGFVVLARGVLDFVFPVALAIYSAVVLLF